MPATGAHAQICLPAEPEGHPAQNIAKERNAEHAGFDDSESKVTGNGVEVDDLVSQWRRHGQKNPEDQRDDGPIAGCVSAWQAWEDTRDLPRGSMIRTVNASPVLIMLFK